VAFDLAAPAQVFGHPDERDRYLVTVCTPTPGLMPTTTGFEISVPAGLEVLGTADTVVVPGYRPGQCREPAPAPQPRHRVKPERLPPDLPRRPPVHPHLSNNATAWLDTNGSRTEVCPKRLLEVGSRG